MNNNIGPKREERLVAMLGLAAQDRKPPGDCPSDEDLAAFIDHSLQGEAHENMLAHLNRCQTCYHHWLEVSSYLNAADPAPQSTKTPTKSRFDLDWLFGTWKVAIPVAAMVMVSVIVAFYLLPNTIHQQIDAGFQVVVAHNRAELDDVMPTLPVPWDDSTFSFSESQGTPAAKAFGAGLWMGQRELVGVNEPLPQSFSPPSDNAWLTTEWTDYYTAGRWSVLLWALVKADLATQEDLRQHQDILEGLLSRFKKRPQDIQATRVITALANIEPLLKSLDTNHDGRSREILNRQLEIMMLRLAPI